MNPVRVIAVLCLGFLCTVFTSSSLLAIDPAMEVKILKEMFQLAPAPSTQPRAILMSGPIGAGKTTFLKRLQTEAGFDLKDYFYISADDIYLKFPEAKGILARLALNPSDQTALDEQKALYSSALSLSWELLDYAINHSINFVFDSVLMSGAQEHFHYLVTDSGKKFFTSLILVKVSSTDVLVDRVRTRAGPKGEEPGRYVPESLIRRSNEGLREGSEENLGLFDEYFQISNDGQLILVKARSSQGSELRTCVRILTEIGSP